MSRLYIVGDSFGSIEDTKDVVENCWTRLLASKLGVDRVINNSLLGAGQDFAWFSLHNWITEIRPNDYLVVLLTHPGRFWFFDEFPHLAKTELFDGIEHEIGYARCYAAIEYAKYIQRPQLDEQWMLDRLGWLAYSIRSYGIKNVLVVQAIDQYCDIESKFPDLNISKGNLGDHVSLEEVKPRVSNEEYLNVVAMRDPRYNHMCLRNHVVLADKMYNSIVNNTKLDLTSPDFHKGFLTKESIADPGFQASDLCPVGVQRYVEDHANSRKFLALKKLVGLGK